LIDSNSVIAEPDQASSVSPLFSTISVRSLASASRSNPFAFSGEELPAGFTFAFARHLPGCRLRGSATEAPRAEQPPSSHGDRSLGTRRRASGDFQSQPDSTAFQAVVVNNPFADIRRAVSEYRSFELFLSKEFHSLSVDQIDMLKIDGYRPRLGLN
jgi:hypothetical protein